MYSIDAMLSICFLFLGLIIILGALTGLESQIQESGDSLLTKGLVLKCTAFFESANSNNATKFETNNCYQKEGNIFAEYGNKRKIIKIINFDRVNHYGKGNDFFD
jgi:hypothetical protein